ncbi:phosphate-binding protein [halophilic archaeon]|nr:phosphate-binding protein [halophilic archaeon]
MVNRRTFLKSAGAAGALGLAGCTSNDGSSDGTTTDTTNGSPGTGTGTTTKSGSDGTVNFILTPAESSVNVKKQYAGVIKHIEEAAGVTVNARKAANYPAVFQALKSGRADIADASPTLAVVGADKGVTDVIGIRVAYGAAKYFSLLTAPADSSIGDLSDLNGETVAFADRVSTSGSLFPLYMLKQAGLDIGQAPEGEPKDFEGIWSNHDNAKKAMINRPDVAAAGTGAFATMGNVPKDQFPQRVKDIAAGFDDAGTEDPKLDLLKASQPIPRAPILARSNWSSSKRSDVEQALLDAKKEDFKRSEAEEELWFTGLEKGDASDYEPVRKVKENLGLEFGN